MAQETPPSWPAVITGAGTYALEGGVVSRKSRARVGRNCCFLELYLDGEIGCTSRHNSCLTERYSNNQVLSIICYDKNKLRNGDYEEYHDNGVLIIKCKYIRDSLDGKYTEYHFNGQPRYQIVFSMNRLLEFVSAFDEKGQPLMIGDLVNGNGMVHVYSRNGKLRSYGNYSGGLKNGYWKVVSNSGIADSVQYVDGLRVSTGRYEFTP